MIAVRIGPDMRSAVVGARSYFDMRSEPIRPQELIGHNCINLRQPTRGGLYAWEFEKDGRELNVHVEGQLVFNGTFQMLNAALAGFGLAYVPEDVAQSHIAKGRLKRVLEYWCPRIRAITSITRAATNPRRPSPYWSRRFATVALDQLDGRPDAPAEVPGTQCHLPAGRPLRAVSGDRGDDLDVQFIANLASPTMVTTTGSLSASTSNAGRFFGRGPRGLPDWPFLNRLCTSGLPRPTF
jgi:hypothetical protein